MTPRTRASLSWGAVGGMVFLVLAQGYRLVSDFDPGYPLLIGVAGVVIGVGAVAADAIGRYLAKR